jgi:hypothetical protein
LETDANTGENTGSSSTPSEILFREVQHFRRSWLWLVVGLGLPLFFGLLRMVVVVTGEEVVIDYRPLTRRRIVRSEIVRAEVRRYNAIREYGGWGVKGWSHEKMAYNVGGAARKA